MPATEKMHTENAESSFSVFFVCILQWPALSFVASNFGIEAYQSRFEILLVTEAGFVVSLIHLECAPIGCIGYLQIPIMSSKDAHSGAFFRFSQIIALVSGLGWSVPG